MRSLKYIFSGKKFIDNNNRILQNSDTIFVLFLQAQYFLTQTQAKTQFVKDVSQSDWQQMVDKLSMTTIMTEKKQSDNETLDFIFSLLLGKVQLWPSSSSQKKYAYNHFIALSVTVKIKLLLPVIDGLK